MAQENASMVSVNAMNSTKALLALNGNAKMTATSVVFATRLRSCVTVDRVGKEKAVNVRLADMGVVNMGTAQLTIVA